MEELKAKIAELEKANETLKNEAEMYCRFWQEGEEKMIALDAKLTAVKAIISIL